MNLKRQGRKLVQHMITWPPRPITILGKWKVIHFSATVFVCVMHVLVHVSLSCELGAPYKGRVEVIEVGC